MIIEGVSYSRYRVTFTLADGRRRRWYRWAPGGNFACEAIRRELADRDIQIRGNVHVQWDGVS